MPRLVAYGAGLMLVLALPAWTRAQIAPAGKGFRAEYLAEMSVAEDHLIRLAEAIPAEKYTWRPAEGVRSVSEVFLHVAGSNFNLPRVLGLAPPEGMVGGVNTYRGVLYFMARHTGEHTGQLIAYARFMGVVPPWTAGS